VVRRADGRFDFYVAVNGRNDAYPAGTNTRRVRRALASLFGGAVSMAQGGERLGRMERPLACNRTDAPGAAAGPARSARRVIRFTHPSPAAHAADNSDAPAVVSQS
jgi:hypothetical protein